MRKLESENEVNLKLVCCPVWMKEWLQAERRAELFRKAGFKAEVVKRNGKFLVDLVK